MKPRTIFQKNIVALQEKLKPVTNKQIQWGYDNCFSNQGFFTKKKAGCLECGHTWEQNSIKPIKACTCPSCGKKLTMERTSCRKHSDSAYYSIVTTYKGFQIIRMLYLSKYSKLGDNTHFVSTEVMQFWVDRDGKSLVFSMLVNPFGNYADTWILHSTLELRGGYSDSSSFRYSIIPLKVYPFKSFIPEVKRNGFSGDFYDIAPQVLLVRLLSDSRTETLLKAKQTRLLSYYMANFGSGLKQYWDSVKICIRNNYIIKNPSLWTDYIILLSRLGKDVKNPHFVCPKNLIQLHNHYLAIHNKKRRKKEEANRQALLEEAQVIYEQEKSIFFGVQFQESELSVQVLQNTKEFKEEGDKLKHCVFASEYYKKTDSLIMSARIGDQSVETVEISLPLLKVVQSRGLQNVASEYNERIISLVNQNMHVIGRLYEQNSNKHQLQST